ncbi:hypothetical protein [Lysinibacillus sp. LZ02]|uniref:hypothetical protein n=1 Tax=Lysinibacillus sp. LZ02 TaxID=3420668 RepID=UPI003D35AD04
MKDQKKSKWILGTSGVVLSAVLLTQFNDDVQSESTITALNLANEQTENMSEREKELTQLDWTNFEIVGVNQPQPDRIQMDRRTRRS